MFTQIESNTTKRTKRNFKEAFVSLIQEKGYSEVTVKDIVEKAGYNRSSFYKYFVDKEAITEEIINEVIEGFSDACRKSYKAQNYVNMSMLSAESVELFKYIYKNSIYFNLLIIDDTIPFFQNRLINLMKNILKEEISFLTDKKVDYNSDFLISFRAFGTYGIILDWIKSCYMTPPLKLEQEIINLYTNSFPFVYVKSGTIGQQGTTGGPTEGRQTV